MSLGMPGIIGIGIDLIEIDRIRQVLARFPERFLARSFTDIEQASAARLADPAAFLAKRFAAKEACAKALGLGFRNGLRFSDIGVKTETSGKPVLVLSENGSVHLRRLLPPGCDGVLHLSLTDGKTHAQAMVIVEARARA